MSTQKYDEELFNLCRNDDYEGIFRVMAQRKKVAGDYLDPAALLPGTQYEVRIVACPKPREWEIYRAGPLQIAEGWELQKGERVKVREILP